MIVDFHTHLFPDKIAPRTIELLSQKCQISAFSDGPRAGLLRDLERAGVDVAVNLPVLTNPAQFESVNRFAAEINREYAASPRKILSFAGIHPCCEDIDRKMRWIRENGFLGVKIHPDYQETFIDDEGYIRILSCAKELDLIVVTHAGVDAGYPGMPVRCTPDRLKKVIGTVRHSKFVLGHYGGNEMSDEVLDVLCGEDVYFDTALILSALPRERFLQILKKHGEDRILFASDSPWSSMAADVERLRSNAPNKQTERKLLCDNARALLGI